MGGKSQFAAGRGTCVWWAESVDPVSESIVGRVESVSGSGESVAGMAEPVGLG